MNLDRDLSCLKDVSKDDLKLISGGGTTVSTASSRVFVSSSFRNGLSSGSGRSFSIKTVDGVVTKSDEKSFTFGPSSEPFSISIESSVD